MRHVMVHNHKYHTQLNIHWAFFLLMCLLVAGAARSVEADTLDARYPGLSQGLLKTARLIQMPDDTVLTADGVSIASSDLSESIKKQDPKLHKEMQKNLIFVLEQEASRRILLGEAQKTGISTAGGDENQAIKALFEKKAAAVSLKEDEVQDFYRANKEMVGDAPFEQVSDSIHQYLLQDKKQQAVVNYLAKLGDTVNMRINEKWVQAQSRLAADNPVDKARNSGKPAMIEFGATGCVPCDMMQPILENLRKDYPQKLNVVFVHVGEEQILASRYGIRSIPVQVFFDAKGKEVFRHVGFFAEAEVVKQLAQMGVVK